MTAPGESAARRAMAALGHAVGPIQWVVEGIDGTRRVRASISPPIEVRTAPDEIGVFRSAIAQVPRGGDDAAAINARVAELVRARCDLVAERRAWWEAEHGRARDALAALDRDDGEHEREQGELVVASGDPRESGRRQAALGLGVDAYREAATLAKALVELRAMRANIKRVAGVHASLPPMRRVADEVECRWRTLELSFGDRIRALGMDPGADAEDASRLWRALNVAASIARST